MRFAGWFLSIIGSLQLWYTRPTSTHANAMMKNNECGTVNVVGRHANDKGATACTFVVFRALRKADTIDFTFSECL